MGEQLGYGTTFSWDGVVVAGLKAINGIELTADSVDATTHPTSGGDYYKKSNPGLIEAGDISLEGFFDYTDTTGQQAMLTDFNNRVTRTAIITFPSAIGTTWTVTGYITNIKIGDAPVDDNIPFTATIKPTGKPVLAVATSNNLSNLAVDTATLYPSFAAGTYDYTATSTGTSVTVTPTASEGTITVNGNTVAIGDASGSITLGAAGSVTVVTIVVTEANKAPKTYTVRIAKTA